MTTRDSRARSAPPKRNPLPLSETNVMADRAVAAAAREFSDMGWAFREVAYDFGMDALAEEVSNDFLTRRLVALVVKAGRALFSEPDGGGWLYRGRNDELSYWLSRLLPVVLLVHDPDTGRIYWQHVTPTRSRTRIRAGRSASRPSTSSARMPVRRSRP